MNNMGLSDAVAILHDNRVWSEAEWCAYIAHPASGDWHKFTTLHQLHRMRPVGDDGATIERHPAVALGHMPTFSPPASSGGNGEHPGGTPAAPSGVGPHQQAVKARWS